MWKAEIDWIPTREVLAFRNIPVNTTICSLCEEGPENANHLLLSCQMANRVWQCIGSWCKIPPIFAFVVRDLLIIHKTAPLCNKKKKVLQGIIMTTCWCIWKARNQTIFENKESSVDKVIEEVKSLAFL
ncbi:uncharacterized protein LOC143554448 [Bidens hawaiensis]|uniref:uncharacterized protein LOC143554448 n=1 Tax=Bidens hawaiensis TaxID=980011 RepID=UPI00404947BE